MSSIQSRCDLNLKSKKIRVALIKVKELLPAQKIDYKKMPGLNWTCKFNQLIIQIELVLAASILI